MEHQITTGEGVRPSLYSSALDEAWQRVDDIREDFSSDTGFHRDRYKNEIANIHEILRGALRKRELSSNNEGQRAFRDYYSVDLFAGVVESIVYLPQLYVLGKGERMALRNPLTARLERGATRTLRRAYDDERRRTSGEHLQSYVGLENELVALSLLNREVVVNKHDTAVLPAHRILDLSWKTDLQAIPISDPSDEFRIQVKTRPMKDYHESRGVVTIYAHDFGNADHRTSKTMRLNQIEKTPERQAHLDFIAEELVKHVGKLYGW